MKQIEFTREKTAIVKGFAIVFMIILHVFGGSGWYDTDLAMNHNEALMSFMPTFKLCVGMYVFMVGYGYAFCKSRDFVYSIRHVKRLLTCFWLILFLFSFPAAVTSGAVGGGKELLLNMLGISSTLCWVSWFVYFYIWAMFIMPFVSWAIDRNPKVITPLLMLLAYGAMFGTRRFVLAHYPNDWTQALFDCLLNTPLMLMGYAFARLSVFERIHIPESWTSVGVSFLIAAVILVARAYTRGTVGVITELIYAPAMILCILSMFTAKSLNVAVKVMKELGDKSVYMWFFHAIFFTAATRPVYQRFVMASDNLWVIAIWTIVISYVCSRGIKKIVDI